MTKVNCSKLYTIVARPNTLDVTGFVDPPLVVIELFSKINKLVEGAYENET